MSAIQQKDPPPTYEQALAASRAARRDITAGIDDCQLCGATGMVCGPRAIQDRCFWMVECETCGVRTGPHYSRRDAVRQWHLICRRSRSEVASARCSRIWRRVRGWIRSAWARGDA